LYESLLNGNKRIAVLGLGYVGLPVALAFARKFRVIGFDINPEKVEILKTGVDPTRELDSGAFQNTSIIFSSDPGSLSGAHFYVVTVPTPVDEHQVPDLKPLLSATALVGKVLKKGDFVVYESTVYPGCTEEDCIPLLEEISGLRCESDFKVAYSPERINPGDQEHTLEKILKVVAGIDDETLDQVARVYGEVITAGVYKARSIKVAEAAKVIENTQRDLNISFMNELSIIFDKMNIDTKEVLEAAGTKWNFLKFTPGLVGGHCIGVDPYYLLYKSKEIGYDPEVILSGRRINDAMAGFIARKLVQILINKGKSPQTSKVLVMGITFKENVADIRNSKVIDLIKELMGYAVTVDITDPFASGTELTQTYRLSIADHISNDYDAVVVAVSHQEYYQLKAEYFLSIMRSDPVLIDIKGIYDFSGHEIEYWRL
jgi:UDP-N-acetyl-D-galactosamine dehydrogenase